MTLKNTVTGLRRSARGFIAALAIFSMPLASYAQNAPAPDKVQEAQKKLSDAQKKLEKAEEDFDNAAGELFTNPDYAGAKDLLDMYKSGINDAKKSKAIAEQKANAAFQTAAKLGLKPQLAFHPMGKAMIDDAIQDYIDAVGIVYAREEAVEEATNTYYEKIREYLNTIHKQLKPDEPTVVEKLDDAERDVAYAKKELQEAQDAEDARVAKPKAGVKPVQMMPAENRGERPAEERAPSFWERFGPLMPPIGMGGSDGDSRDRRMPEDRRR